jgi:uncharacterized membrane protein YccC
VAQAVQHPPLLRVAGRIASVSPATAYAVRFAAVVCVAIWLGKAPGLVESHSTWILITVLMVSQPMTGGSLMKGLLRGVGTAAAFVTSILIFGLWAQDPPLLMAGLFLVQAVGAYGFSGSRYQYAWFVWAFTTAIVLGEAMVGAGAVEVVAFERASMVGIGLLCVFVADSLLWPSRAEPSLRASLAGRARQLAAALRRAIDARSSRPEGRAADEGTAASPLVDQLTLLDAARSEVGVSRARLTALTHAALLLEALASRERILRRPHRLEPGAPIAAALGELGRRVEAALCEVAAALVSGRAPSPFAARLEWAIVELDAERARPEAADVAVARRSAALRDLVALLRTLEGLAAQTTGVETPAAPPVRLATRLELDPFRVRIALRAGIAVCVAFLVPMVLGWTTNTMVAPLSFMIAAMTTRGAVTQSLGLLAGIVLFTWLLADMALVGFTPHVGRMPLALLYPAAVAGAFAYVRMRRPQLALLPSIGGLLAILPVFSGTSAPTDVYGSYSTMCYVATGLGTGWLASRLLWPATAATLFRERAAAQLELCCEALRQRDPSAGRAERQRQQGEFLAAHTKGLAQLGALHGQARHEPVERFLDDARRAELLGLTRDLCDAVRAARGQAVAHAPAFLERGGGALAPLREALSRVDEALLASLRKAAARVRGEAAVPGPDLAAARDALEARIAELRARPELQPALGPREREAFLVHIDSRRQLVNRQLAIEQWLSGR